eukprot:5433839-Amphidinium_carterae.1
MSRKAKLPRGYKTCPCTNCLGHSSLSETQVRAALPRKPVDADKVVFLRCVTRSHEVAPT